MMKITLTGFESADSYNSNIYHLGKALIERGTLNKIICKASYTKKSEIDNKFIKKESIPLAFTRFALHKMWRYISHKIPDRYYSEQILFDIFSVQHIQKDTDLIFYTDAGLLRSLRKAKSLSVSTITMLRTLYPKTVYETLKKESERFNVSDTSILSHYKWNNNRIKTLEESDTVFVLSELAKETAIINGLSESKIDVIHHGQGVDTEYFKPRENVSDEHEFKVLFVGHKSLIKGVPYLLEAWKNLELKNSRLIIAGEQDNDIIARYKKYISFEAIGSVNPLEYYQTSSIYVLPSLGDSFPRTQLEAMSCGLPVIVSEMTGACDIIENGKEGFIVPIRNSKSLEESIGYFHDNPAKIKRMGRNARKTAERYTWKKFEEEVITKIELIHDDPK